MPQKGWSEVEILTSLSSFKWLPSTDQAGKSNEAYLLLFTLDKAFNRLFKWLKKYKSDFIATNKAKIRAPFKAKVKYFADQNDPEKKCNYLIKK